MSARAVGQNSKKGIIRLIMLSLEDLGFNISEFKKNEKGNDMFNMKKVGLRISELRKKNNMTQLGLADTIGVSFQAVSNWERGISMPDISKLPELAELFGVTIDDLLGDKSPIINSAATDTLGEYLEENGITASQLAEVAPILKPEQVDESFRHIGTEKLRGIEELLPFLNKSTVNALAESLVNSGNYRYIGEIAPFADTGVVDGVARKMVADGRSIGDIAPFLSKSYFSEFADKYFESLNLSALEDILPFIPKDKLCIIADAELKAYGFRRFLTIAPFLDKGYLNSIAVAVIEEQGICAVAPIAPFLDKDMLSEYIAKTFL